jgi:hypothetical protein
LVSVRKVWAVGFVRGRQPLAQPVFAFARLSQMGGCLATMTGVHGYLIAEPLVVKSESHQSMEKAMTPVLVARRELHGAAGATVALVIDNTQRDGPGGVAIISKHNPEIAALGLPPCLAIQDRLHREFLTGRSLMRRHPDFKQASSDLKQLFSEVHIVHSDAVVGLDPVDQQWYDAIPHDSQYLGCLAAFHRLMRGKTVTAIERQRLISLFKGARHHVQTFFGETTTNSLSVPHLAVIRRCARKLGLSADTVPKLGFPLPSDIGDEYVILASHHAQPHVIHASTPSYIVTVVMCRLMSSFCSCVCFRQKRWHAWYTTLQRAPEGHDVNLAVRVAELIAPGGSASGAGSASDARAGGVEFGGLTETAAASDACRRSSSTHTHT